MKYRGLELKVKTAIEKRLEEGWNVTPGGVFVDGIGGQCCAVGAIIAGEFDHNTMDALEAASRALGISEDEALSISDGFEGYAPVLRSRTSKLGRLHDIGVRARRAYCHPVVRNDY